MRLFGMVGLAAIVVAQRVDGQATKAWVGRDSVTVVPGKAYAKSGTYRFFFGTHYRDLWTTPIRVPVLDLTTFAGGLTPLKEGGGQQTKSLRLQGADGRQYAFRSVDKDPSAALPPELRETFADRVFQDQISSAHPGGALVVPTILSAAGVLHVDPILVVMPDDERLGKFRQKFASVLGTLEERPNDADDDDASFAGAKEIVATDKLIRRLEKEPGIRVDARAFLLARLTDVFLGDWDRHQGQWRWALVDQNGHDQWMPIPNDRDQAFVRFDGLLLRLSRPVVPQLLEFGPEYGPIVGATWNGRSLDRRLLTELERPVWDSIARVLTERITDQVITDATHRLPAELYAKDGERLAAALRHRRDRIPAMADKYYRHLVREVDIYGSDRSDLATVTRADDRFVDVTVQSAGQDVYRRRFDSHETRDIRLYLEGGDDRAQFAGSGGAGITVRVIGGGGNDRFVDSAQTGPVRFYDSQGTNQAVGHGINTKPYRAVDDTTDPTALPHRDWGRRALIYPLAGYGPDVGLVLGVGGSTRTWGFRKKPDASLLRYRLAYAIGASTGRAELFGRFQRENSRAFFGFTTRVSGIEVLRWYGFGNDRAIDVTQPTSYYRVNQHQVAVEPVYGWSIGRFASIVIGPSFTYSVTEVDDGENLTRFIGTDLPYGSRAFATMAGKLDFQIDTRDAVTSATRGVFLSAGVNVYPAIFDVDRSFAKVRGQVSTYLTPKALGRPTLALLAGAERVIGADGRVPFFEAPFLGSADRLRGYRSHRFAGDEGAVYGSAELRLHLTNLFLFVPGEQGVFGFGDVGRVYSANEVSDTWHSDFGGGIWFGFLRRANILSLSLGHSVEGTRFSARAGFAF